MTDGPIYICQRDRFLAGCGELSENEREKALALFDQTFCAELARLGDALNVLFATLRKVAFECLIVGLLLIGLVRRFWEALL